MSQHARFIALLVAAALAGCAADGAVAPAAPSATVAFSAQPAPLVVGDTTTVSVTLNVASERDVAWTSSDTSVAVVRASHGSAGAATATILALRPGTTRIRATVNGTSADAGIQVRPRVSGLGLFPRASVIATGESRRLVALAERVAHTDTTTLLDSREPGFGSLSAAWSSGNPQVARIDAEGNVTGVSAGTTTISVSIDGFSTTAQVTVQAPAAHHLAIAVDASGAPEALTGSATRAATRWSRVIASDLPSVRLEVAAGTCGAGTAAVRRDVEDVLVIVRADSIDGPGGAVASATPCLVRDDWTPTLSVITVDVADLGALESSGHLDDVVAHEMGHALGIGMLWLVRQVVQGWGTSDPRFVGAATRQAAFDAGALASEADSVPVENAGGSGTANEHWRSGAFGAELMTGWLSSAPAALSAVTVASLRDVGYDVDPTGAESFVATAAPVRGTIGGAGLARSVPPVALRERTGRPRFRIGHDGRLRAAD